MPGTTAVDEASARVPGWRLKDLVHWRHLPATTNDGDEVRPAEDSDDATIERLRRLHDEGVISHDDLMRVLRHLEARRLPPPPDPNR